MQAEAGVRALHERDVLGQVRSVDVELVGTFKHLGVAVGCQQVEGDELASRDGCATELDVDRGVAVDPRCGRFESERLVDDLREQRPVGPQPVELLGVGQQVPERVRRHALGRFDRTEHHNRDSGRDLVGPEHAVGDELGDEAGVVGPHCIADVGVEPTECFVHVGWHLAANGQGNDRFTECAIPAENLGRIDIVKTEHIENGLHRQRTGHTGSEFATIGQGRFDKCVRVLMDASLKFFTHKLRTERRSEGFAMAGVLRAIERQHRCAQNLGGRKAVVVDSKSFGVDHGLDCEVAPGHKPSAQRRQPRHGFVGP